MDFAQDDDDDRLRRAYTAGWMQGWVDSGCSAPPRAENAPQLPDKLLERSMPLSVSPTREQGDCEVAYDTQREARSWMSKPNARSGIIARSVTVIYQHNEEVPVVKFMSLPNMARPLMALGHHIGDGKAAWNLEVMFYVDNETDYRVFDKRYALLTVGSNASLTGSKIEDTEIRFWYGGVLYFMFRVY